MNRSQKKVIMAALVLIVLIGLFPPWVVGTSERDNLPFWLAWYGSWDDPAVNVGYVVAQWLVVIIVAAGWCLLLVDKEKSEQSGVRRP